MKHIEGRFNGVRRTDIYYQAWLPETEAQALLLLVHGLGEHCGRYMNVVERLVPKGYAVYGLDHLGHGKSGGAREMVARFEDFTDTLAVYDAMLREWQPDKPVFLVGHSMGGLIACSYLLEHQQQFKGAIISAPAIKVSDNISKATITVGKVLSKLMPRAGVLALNAESVSRDPEVVKAYLEDPLVFTGKTPARLAAELLGAMQRVSGSLERINLPFIALQGSADRLVDPGGAQMLYDRAASPDKTLKIYDGLFHEVFNEPEHDQVLDDVEAWLADHL